MTHKMLSVIDTERMKNPYQHESPRRWWIVSNFAIPSHDDTPRYFYESQPLPLYLCRTFSTFEEAVIWVEDYKAYWPELTSVMSEDQAAQIIRESSQKIKDLLDKKSKGDV